MHQQQVDVGRRRCRCVGQVYEGDRDAVSGAVRHRRCRQPVWSIARTPIRRRGDGGRRRGGCADHGRPVVERTRVQKRTDDGGGRGGAWPQTASWLLAVECRIEGLSLGICQRACMADGDLRSRPSNRRRVSDGVAVAAVGTRTSAGLLSVSWCWGECRCGGAGFQALGDGYPVGGSAVRPLEPNAVRANG